MMYQNLHSFPPKKVNLTKFPYFLRQQISEIHKNSFIQLQLQNYKLNSIEIYFKYHSKKEKKNQKS